MFLAVTLLFLKAYMWVKIHCTQKGGLEVDAWVLV